MPSRQPPAFFGHDLDKALDAEEAGNYEAAEAAYRESWRIAPAWDAPALNLAVMFNQLRRQKEALEQYDKVLKAFPNHTQALFNLGK